MRVFLILCFLCPTVFGHTVNTAAKFKRSAPPMQVDAGIQALYLKLGSDDFDVRQNVYTIGFGHSTNAPSKVRRIAPPESEILELYKQLDDDDFLVRQKAHVAIVAKGKRFEGELLRLLARGASVEQALRVEKIREEMWKGEKMSWAEAARYLVTNAERCRVPADNCRISLPPEALLPDNRRGSEIVAHLVVTGKDRFAVRKTREMSLFPMPSAAKAIASAILGPDDSNDPLIGELLFLKSN